MQRGDVNGRPIGATLYAPELRLYLLRLKANPAADKTLSAYVDINPQLPESELESDSIVSFLPMDAVLNCLRTKLPQQYERAEVVGKWVWLDVSPARKPMLAKVLWSLGFHWNQRRGVWQHPCGRFDPLGSHPTDPRAKYRSYFPADVLPA